MPQRRALECYVVGERDSWEAICIDLDIAVQGDSFDDVRLKLGEAIKSYLAYVLTLPEHERERLLHRRVPWHVRLRFAMGVIATMLFHRGNGGGKQSFGLPCTV